MLEACLISLCAVLGVITQRVVGFGIAAFLAPVALILFAPPVAIITTLFVGTLSCILIVIQARRNNLIMIKVLVRILLPAIPGLLIGAYVITRIDKSLLQMIVGCVVIAAILIQQYVLPKPTRPLGVTRGITLAGFMSGFFNATAANGAPPMVMWLRTHISTPDQIRQNIAGMFIIINLCSLTAIHFLKPEIFDRDLLVKVLPLIPAVFLGNAIGNWVIRRVNLKLYEKLVVVTIIVTGLISFGIGATSRF